MRRAKGSTPPKSDKRKRGKLTAFWVTEEEFTLIRDKAESKGTTLGGYMRDLVLEDARSA